LARASQIMAPTSCFTGQVHRLPDAPEAYGAMITRAKAAPPQSRSAALTANPEREKGAVPRTRATHVRQTVFDQPYPYTEGPLCDTETCALLLSSTNSSGT
jgi:hypothetical protein